MNHLDDIAELQTQEQGLAVVTTVRDDGSVQASVVNCGLMNHPVTGARVVAWASRAGAVKLRNLRQRTRATATFRRGWQWGTVEGHVDLIGPDDDLEGFDPAGLAELHRTVFRSAGGAHDDWDQFDQTMADEGRTVVLLTPDRVYSNPY